MPGASRRRARQSRCGFRFHRHRASSGLGGDARIGPARRLRHRLPRRGDVRRPRGRTGKHRRRRRLRPGTGFLPRREPSARALREYGTSIAVGRTRRAAMPTCFSSSATYSTTPGSKSRRRPRWPSVSTSADSRGQRGAGSVGAPKQLHPSALAIPHPRSGTVALPLLRPPLGAGVRERSALLRSRDPVAAPVQERSHTPRHTPSLRKPDFQGCPNPVCASGARGCNPRPQKRSRAASIAFDRSAPASVAEASSCVKPRSARTRPGRNRSPRRERTRWRRRSTQLRRRR